MKLIEAAWQDFRRVVYAQQPLPEERTSEARHAFFSGAVMAVKIIMDNRTETEAEYHERLTDLREELLEFLAGCALPEPEAHEPALEVH